MNVIISSVFRNQQEKFSDRGEKEQIQTLINEILSKETEQELKNKKSFGYKQFKLESKYKVGGFDLNIRSAERIISSFLHDYPDDVRKKFDSSLYLDPNKLTIILHRITPHDMQSHAASIVGNSDFEDFEYFIGKDRTIEHALELKELYSVVKENKIHSILTHDKEQIVSDFIHSNKMPMLLEGVAGSGKTEVIKSIINIWAPANTNKKVLYVTASQALVNEVERQTSVNLNNVDYQTLNGVINKFNKSSKSPLNYQSFEKMFEDDYVNSYQLLKDVKTLRNRVGLLRIYSEIHGIILGQLNFSTQKALTKHDYLNQYFEESIAQNKHEKEILFDIAQIYKNYRSNEFFEPNTLCMDLFSKLELANLYDLILIDEVQDFTSVQFTFLTKLVKSTKSIFMTGDPNQTINPTLFDVSNIKNLFYRSTELNIIEPLLQNYRNSSVITQLINILNSFRNDKLTARKMKYSRDEVGQSPVSGRIYHYSGSMEGLTKLTKTSNVIEIVSDLNESKNLFRVIDVKGLEYEHVIVRNLISDYADLLDSIFDDTYKKSKSMHYYFNLFYVAISRVIKNLIIVEEKNTRFFNELKDQLNNLGILDVVDNVDDMNIEIDESIDRIYQNGIKLALNQLYKAAHNQFEIVYQANPYYPKIYELVGFTTMVLNNKTSLEIASYLESCELYELAEQYYKLVNHEEKYALMALYRDEPELFSSRLSSMGSKIDVLSLYDDKFTNSWQKMILDEFLEDKLLKIQSTTQDITKIIDTILEVQHGEF